MLHSSQELDLVFGPDSSGSDPLTRALSSTKRFVRSQTQVAEWRPEAKGLELTPAQALHAFDYDVLLRVARDGSAQLIPSRTEPARTIEERRKELGLTAKQIARMIDLPEASVVKAETVGKVSPIRDLMRIAEALALDEQVLSYLPNARGDSELGVRLRTLSSERHAGPGFSPSIVLKLTEAAWVISRQSELARLLGVAPEVTNESYSDDYHGPVWQRGYELAAQTRTMLSIDDEAPIENVRKIVARFGLPLIETAFGTRFAGATIANADVRGIVANTEGSNSNVWVRRMTICHELGHLLWDPPSRLGKLKVDTYMELQTPGGDPVEARANAFAIAFLAPPRAVARILDDLSDKATMVAVVMDRFGIGPGAAKHHLANVSREHLHREIDFMTVSGRLLPEPSDEWNAREDWTNAFYPIASVPDTRRGAFAALAVLAMERGLVSADTVSEWLRIAPEEVAAQRDNIVSLGEVALSRP